MECRYTSKKQLKLVERSIKYQDDFYASTTERIKRQSLNRFKRRELPVDFSPFIHSYWIKELSAIFFDRVGLKSLSKKLADKSIANEEFDRKVAKYIHRHHDEIDCIYGYEDTSYYSFSEAKKYGIKCIYELPIGYWRKKNQILSEQINTRPEWASTMGIDCNDIEKLHRKDLEISLADLIVVPSVFVEKSLELYPDSLPPIAIVPYGAPSQINYNKNGIRGGREKLKALFCGGLTQRKGIADIADVYDRTSDLMELTVIGNGNIESCPPLGNFINKVNHIKSVSHDELLKIMAESDIFLFPSHFEGFALVVFDAMSQGCPLITTLVTSGPIKDGYDGWIVEPGDVDSMVKLIESLYTNREYITRCSLNARLTASKNTWEKYHGDLINVLNSFSKL